GIEVEELSVTVTADGEDVTDNYKVMLNTGDLTILKLTEEPEGPGPGEPEEPDLRKIILEIMPEDYEAAYTGKEISIPANHGAEVLHGGEPMSNYPLVSVTFTMSGSGLTPNKYPITVDQLSVMVKADGEDVTDNYEVVLYDGELTIISLTGEDRIALFIQPKDAKADFTGSEVVVSVENEGLVTMDGTPLSDFPALDVTFMAEGKGLYAGEYPIDLDTASVKVMAGMVDVTGNYVLSSLPGKLTIEQSQISITIGIEDPSPLTYNATEQGYQQYVGKGITNLLPAGAEIRVVQSVQGVNAGNYPIVFTQADVTITLAGQDITGNYSIQCINGNMVIEKKKLIGTLTADTPAGSFTYGDTVSVDHAEYAFETGFGFEGSDTLPYMVDKSPNTNDAYDSGMNQIQYTFMPRLEPSGLDANYDTTELLMVPSAQITLNRAKLTISPETVYHPQRDQIPTSFNVTATGYKYNDSLLSAGPDDVIYWTDAQPYDAIGTHKDIAFVSGSQTIQNYEVSYQTPGEFIIYGWVAYHANYPTGNDVMVRDTKRYLSPDEMVVTRLPQALGFGKEGLLFEGWTLDAAGTMPYTPGAIGEQSFELYAQWAKAYKLTIKHQDSSGVTLAADQILWKPDGAIVVISALELNGYYPDHIAYVSMGVEYVQSISSIIDVLISMPKGDVEAVIYYVKQAGTTTPPGGGTGEQPGGGTGGGGTTGGGSPGRQAAGTVGVRTFAPIPDYYMPQEITPVGATEGFCID
ncbi:MAG: hypothetical protein FWG37_04210, partial [Clostridia bacterium]|nr:hypothetical protein [Clostridia bacterium]